MGATLTELSAPARCLTSIFNKTSKKVERSLNGIRTQHVLVALLNSRPSSQQPFPTCLFTPSQHEVLSSSLSLSMRLRKSALPFGDEAEPP
jgi:hypothetical protein